MPTCRFTIAGQVSTDGRLPTLASARWHAPSPICSVVEFPPRSVASDGRRQGDHAIEVAVEIAVAVVHYEHCAAASALFHHLQHQLPAGLIEVRERLVGEVHV